MYSRQNRAQLTL